MAEPLGVLVGFTEPHTEPGQLNVQLTPEFVGSLLTVAITCADVPASKGKGDIAGWAIVTEIAAATPVMVTAAVTVLVGSAVDATVMVTLPPGGTDGGAV